MVINQIIHSSTTVLLCVLDVYYNYHTLHEYGCNPGPKYYHMITVAYYCITKVICQYH